MAKGLSAFRSVEDLDNVFVAEKGGLRCSAIRLKTGNICLFSPVQGLGDTARESLAALGPVTQVLAPNHYHNKGLIEYSEAFPEATLCAPERATPRLEKQTGLSFEPLDNVKTELPDTVQIIEPRGLKTGEIWLRAQSEDQLAWLVVDAFCGSKGSMTGVSDTPGMLGTFPSFGIADKPVYKSWVEKQIEADQPTSIIPCHGQMVGADNLAGKLLALVGDKLKS
ncbi:MAG: hypothetical protein ABJN26_01465 [Stappiaceae bacterium]